MRTMMERSRPSRRRAARSVLSGRYQAREMSTMVSALTRVVAGDDDRWAPSAWLIALSGGGGQWAGREDLAMPHGYVHAQGSYSGAPTTEFAAATAMAAADPAVVRYRGVARLPDGRWRGYITNKEDKRFDVGRFDTVEAAALAHDRAILAILGPDASTVVFNFRAAFSDTELRFLKGRHAPPRPAVVIGMIIRGTFDAELAGFAARAFDAYMDPELALDVMAFRFAHRDVLNQRKAAAVAGVADPAARAAEERDVEREVFLEAARNKATDGAWVRGFHRRRRQVGATFEDENRWPPVLPPINVDVGDSFTGNELIYLPHGGCYVDEMVVF